MSNCLNFPWLGTLLAIITTFVTYLCYGLIIGAVTVPNASGNATEYTVWRYGYNNPDHGNFSEDVFLFTQCDERDQIDACEFGSANDQQVSELRDCLPCFHSFLQYTVIFKYVLDEKNIFCFQNMAKISYTGYLIFAGCFAATLSSAIGKNDAQKM